MWKSIETFDYKKYRYIDVLVRGQDGVAVAAWDDDENEFISDLRGKGNGQTVYGPTQWMEIPKYRLTNLPNRFILII
jgi:hypothetical protein